MTKKRVFYFIFFTILVVGFYFTMTSLIPQLAKPVIPPIGTVKEFSFTNQDGVKVTEKDMANKVTVVEFFFTTCKGICPRMNKNLRTIYDQFKTENDFLILSHTCDPAIDTVAQLKKYADSMAVDTKKWMFLTGSKDSLYHMARHSYKIDDPKNDLNSIEDDFLHTQFMAIVNKKGDIVKIYDGLKKDEIKEMKSEIENLLKK
jgi:protein SCO1/2